MADYHDIERLNKFHGQTSAPLTDYSKKDNARRRELFEKLGVLSPSNDGFLTETAQGFAQTSLEFGKGIGSTLEEAGLGSGIKEYFEDVQSVNQHLRPHEDYTTLSLNPGNLGRTIGSAIGSSLVPLVAGTAASLATGGSGGAFVAAGIGTTFASLYGERAKEYRALMPDRDKSTADFLAFLSATGESIVEYSLGPERLAPGMAKKLVSDAINKTMTQAVAQTGRKAFINKLGKSLAGSIAKSAGQGAREEFGEEIIQSLWDGLMKSIGTGDNQMPSLHELAEAGAGGFIGGAALGGMFGGVNHFGNRGNNITQEIGNNSEQTLSPEQRAVQAVADDLGVKVTFFDDENGPRGPNGELLNGLYNEETGEILLNRNGNPMENFGHEYFHLANHQNTELFGEIKELIQKGLNEKGKAELAQVTEDYKGIADGMEEFSADTMGRMFADPEFMQEYTTKLEQMQKGLGQKLLDAIKDFLELVQKTLKQIGDPAYKEMFDNVTELKNKTQEFLLDARHKSKVESVDVQTVAPVTAQAVTPSAVENTETKQPEIQSTPEQKNETKAESAPAQPVVTAPPVVEEVKSEKGKAESVSTPAVEEKVEIPNGYDLTEYLSHYDKIESYSYFLNGVLPGKYKVFGHDLEVQKNEGQTTYIFDGSKYGLNNLSVAVKGLAEQSKRPTQEKIEPTQEKIEPTQEKIEPTQEKIEPTQESEQDIAVNNALDKLYIWDKNGGKRVYLSYDFVKAVKDRYGIGIPSVYNNAYYDLENGTMNKNFKKPGMGGISDNINSVIIPIIKGKFAPETTPQVESKPQVETTPVTETKPDPVVESKPQEQTPKAKDKQHSQAYLKAAEHAETLKKAARGGFDLTQSLLSFDKDGFFSFYLNELPEGKYSAFGHEFNVQNNGDETNYFIGGVRYNFLSFFETIKGFRDEYLKNNPKQTEETQENKPVEEVKPQEEEKNEVAKQPKRSMTLAEMSELTGIHITNIDENGQIKSTTNPEVMREVLDKILLSDDNGIAKSNRIKKLAEESGFTVKQLQEIVEERIILQARRISSLDNLSNKEKFDLLENLYLHQPTLSNRTSTSMINQAYSTPVPLAWLLGQRIGLMNNTVYEPTAGTGLLTVAGDPETIDVNELNDVRLAILHNQRFNKVTSNDATTFVPDTKYDRVIMNPPFGNIEARNIDNIPISKLDHVIAIKALETLKDNGRAAIIVGANTKDRNGTSTLPDYQFMRYLYKNFNVKDNFIVNGDLYRKQGASYPVRVITLDGRANNENIKPPERLEILSDWDTLYQRLNGELKNGISETERSDSGSDTGPGSLRNVDRQEQNTPDGRRGTPGSGQTGSENNSDHGGRNSRNVGAGSEQQPGRPRSERKSKTNTAPEEQLPESSVGGNGLGTVPGDIQTKDMASTPNEESANIRGRDGDDSGRSPERDSSRKYGGSSPDSAVLADTGLKNVSAGESRGELNNTYIAGSNAKPLDVVTPKYLSDDTAYALNKLQEEVGNIDQFVMNELDYKSLDELYNALGDAQVDGVAMAINAVKKGNGFIIGDQTGVGKGRQCAALIRWGQVHDVLPVLFTKDQNLFQDMYRDCLDTNTAFNPYLMATDHKLANVYDKETGKLIAGIPSNKRAIEESFLTFAEKHNAIFTAYTQISNLDSRQQNFLRDLVKARKCLFIMDEAHEAAGESNRGFFFYGGSIKRRENGIPVTYHIESILDNKNVQVVYSSATYAKQIKNMKLYFRTTMSKALNDVARLGEALAKGGIPLQQYLSKMLARGGEYIRRERDFTGVEFEVKRCTPKDPVTGEKSDKKITQTYDRCAKVLKALAEHSTLVADRIHGNSSFSIADTREESAVATSDFASICHNYIAQLILGSKVDVVVEETVRSNKEGRKPIIALINTMETSLNKFIDDTGLDKGDKVDMKYSDVLRAALNRMYSYIDRTDNQRHYANPKELGMEKMHESMLKMISDIDDVDIPISPVDAIKNKLKQQGISCSEITGRKVGINYETGEIYERTDTDRNKNKNVDAFNDGETEVILLNAAGSTGLSLHSSSKFKDQRPREMIVAQPALDINVMQQTLGRANRSGQVNLPKYTFVVSNLAAERRPMMVLSKKMQSLNANTTGNNEGALSLSDDILNKYGTDVAREYLSENPELAEDLNLDPQHTDIVKLTGKIALLPDARQNDILDELTDRYNQYVEFLKNTDNYELEMLTKETWDGVEVSSEEISPADGDSFFQGELTRKVVNIKQHKKIRSYEEVKAEAVKNRATTKDYFNKLQEDRVAADEAIADLPKARPDKRSDQIETQMAYCKNTLAGFETFLVKHIGKCWNIQIGNDTYPGMITNFSIGKPLATSPVAPSKLKVTFAVADTIGKINLNYSQLSGDNIQITPYYGNNPFTGADVDVREDRILFTGNLIRAFDSAEENRGKMVSIRMRSGEVLTGLLMSRSTQGSGLAHDPRNDLNSVNEVIDHLNTSENVYTRDRMHIVSYDGVYRMFAPRKRGKGGNYYTNQDVLRITGDWSSWGREMRTQELTQNQIKKVIKLLIDNGGVQFTKTNPGIHYSLVRDQKLIDKLEHSDYITAYRAMQIGDDGLLHSPMAAKVNGQWLDGYDVNNPQWEQADERPDNLIWRNGKAYFKLDKGNGSSIEARYNPYIHSSNTPLNDQFSSAYKRPNLVTVEVRIPKFDLESGYQAQHAKNPVGTMNWHSGKVASQLKGDKARKVNLSRYNKIMRIVPDSEVAQMIKANLKGTDIAIPKELVTPSLFGELEKAGVPLKYSLKRRKQVNPILDRNSQLRYEYQEMLDNSSYETKPNIKLDEEAGKLIAELGGTKKTIDQMLKGKFRNINDVYQRVTQYVLNSEEFKALNPAEQNRIFELYSVDLGTTAGRALAARRMRPLDYSNIQSIQSHVNAFLAKILKTKAIDGLREDVLNKFNVDLLNIPEDILTNPYKLDTVLKRLALEKASVGDKFYEFWINSILSGPATHAANTIGNTTNAVYELGIKRLAEATVNLALKRKDFATFSEFKAVAKAINWKNALSKAKLAFDLEMVGSNFKLDNAFIAIDGKAGGIIRTPSRLLKAADEFAKAIITPIEATTYAYRQGRNGGLTGDSLIEFMNHQLNAPESEAQEYGRQRAIEIAFQEDPGAAVSQLIQWKNAGGISGTLLKYILPFMRTPSNILKQGFMKSPLGLGRLAYEGVQIARGKQHFDQKVMGHLAEQIIAWGVVAALMGMGDDDDEGMPFITGSSPQYGTNEQKFKANKVPPYSIRIGDTYYSYQRIEPFATGLAFIADGINAFNSAQKGEDGTRIIKRLMSCTGRMVSEKSFLDTVGELSRVVEDPERSAIKFFTNFASSWMPNVYKQARNAFDDNVRDNKSYAKGEKWWLDQFNIVTNSMGITQAVPKYDYFGREITKDALANVGFMGKFFRLIPIKAVTPDDNMSKAELLMWRYNQNHIGEEYYPGIPSYYFRYNGKKCYFEGENYSQYVQDAGQLAFKQINNAFKHGLLNANNPSEKDIDLIKKIFSKSRKMVREIMIEKKLYSE